MREILIEKIEPGFHSNKSGDIWWEDVYGNFHRDGDFPAIKRINGNKFWYKNGLLTRDNDKPAVIYSNGKMMWYKDGKQHRDNNKPAVIYPNGEMEFWINDNLIGLKLGKW